MNYYQYLTSSQLFSNELNDYHLCFESKYFECYVVRIFYDYFVHFCYSKKKKIGNSNLCFVLTIHILWKYKNKCQLHIYTPHNTLIKQPNNKNK